MFNRSGIRSTTYMATKQILADVGNQSAVGCVVPSDMGVTTNGKKLVKAGTPIHIDMMNLKTPCKAASESDPMNAVLLHDVEIIGTTNANGTALVFGTVNVNRVDSDVSTLITSAMEMEGASPLLLFGKF